MGVNHQRTISHPPNVKLPNCMVPNMWFITYFWPRWLGFLLIWTGEGIQHSTKVQQNGEEIESGDGTDKKRRDERNSGGCSQEELTKPCKAIKSPAAGMLLFPGLASLTWKYRDSMLFLWFFHDVSFNQSFSILHTVLKKLEETIASIAGQVYPHCKRLVGITHPVGFPSRNSTSTSPGPATFGPSATVTTVAATSGALEEPWRRIPEPVALEVAFDKPRYWIDWIDWIV